MWRSTVSQVLLSIYASYTQMDLCIYYSWLWFCVLLQENDIVYPDISFYFALFWQVFPQLISFRWVLCYLIAIFLFHVPGFPILGVEWQKMENPDLRLLIGMKPDQKGVRIRRINPTAPEFKILKPSDVILSFDGVDIANDGTGDWDKCSDGM